MATKWYDAPVYAILEFLPHTKRDGTTAEDALTHPYFAKPGSACLRVDMRSNGDSERGHGGRVYARGTGRLCHHFLDSGRAIVHRKCWHDMDKLGWVYCHASYS